MRVGSLATESRGCCFEVAEIDLENFDYVAVALADSARFAVLVFEMADFGDFVSVGEQCSVVVVADVVADNLVGLDDAIAVEVVVVDFCFVFDCFLSVVCDSSNVGMFLQFF